MTQGLDQEVASADRTTARFGVWLLERSDGWTQSGIQERIMAQALLLLRLTRSAVDIAGAERAVELRYGVTPSPEQPWEARAWCALLTRVSGPDPERVAEEDTRLRRDLESVVRLVLPGVLFRPATDEQAAQVRDPFPIADTGEVRRRPTEAAQGNVGMPLFGVPSIDVLLAMMRLQDHPTLLSICADPSDGWSLAVPGAWLRTGSTAGTVAAAAGEAPHSLTDPGADPSVSNVALLTQLHGEAASVGGQAARLTALSQRAFRLRVQVASTAPLADALIATLVGEVGGPGRHTVGGAIEQPTHPVAAGGTWVRPRLTRPGAGGRPEWEIALDNLRGLGFAPWRAGESTTYLADLGEVARLFALPDRRWGDERTRAPLELPFVGHGPTTTAGDEGVMLGIGRFDSYERQAILDADSRRRHTWIIGQTGTGKTTLLESMILQDARAGRGVIVVEPHGDLIAQILGKLPPERMKDVIVFDPADHDRPLGLNPLEADEDQRSMVISAFIDFLNHYFDPNNTGIVGPRFRHGVRNAMMTVMYDPEATLLEVVRIISDRSYLQRLLPRVTDPVVRSYWTDQIASTSDFHKSEVLDYIISKFGPFVTDPTVRRIVGQSKSAFNFRDVMDRGQIVLVSLAKGRLGADTAAFLGMVLLPRIFMAALSRVDVAERDRRDVALYVDEFQNYPSETLALMLAEARKYRLSLTLANQHVGQIYGPVRDALIGNVGNLVSFRVGQSDAGLMEEVFAPGPLRADHFTRLPNFQAYARLLDDGRPGASFTLRTVPDREPFSPSRVQAIRSESAETYGVPRELVDQQIVARYRS